VEYIGGMYDRATGKIYGADGNKAYDPNDTVNFKNINVTHSGFDIGSVAEGNATIAGSVNYAQVQEGADFTMWYLFDGAFGYPYGNSYQNGYFNTRAVFEDSNVTQLLMGGTVIGTDYGDTFNVFQLGTKPFDYDTLRTVDIETGLGDDGDFRRSTANDNCHGAAILYAAGLAG